MPPQTIQNTNTSKDRYAEFLQSEYWLKVSDAVKTRAGYRCQVCNSPHDLAAHHRSYSHRGNELDHLDDLTCLCRRCHGTMSLPQPAPVAPPPERLELVLITAANCKRLRCNKGPWHWIIEHGINPRKSGWAERAIGFRVPIQWMIYA